MSINISPQIEARVTTIAQQKGIDPETYLEKILIEHLPTVETIEQEDVGDFGGRTLGEVFGHLFGTVKTEPSDKALHPEQYMQGFGETNNPRTLAK